MKLELVLARADDQNLQTFFGKAALRILLLLDQTFSPERMSELIINVKGEQELLLNRESRQAIIDLLRPDEAITLATVLNIQYNYESIYEDLKSTRIQPNTDKQRALLDFFELPYPQISLSDSSDGQKSVNSEYELFLHQRKACREVSKYLYSRKRRVVLHMPTGSGKTRTAMNVIAEHLRTNEPTNVLWLASSEELCIQAAHEFEQAWGSLGNRSISLNRYWSNYNLSDNDIGDSFTIAGLQKLFSTLRRDIPLINALTGRTSLIVFDEAHSAIAETYSLLVETFLDQREDSCLLGLTATPGRTWEDISEDKKLAEFFHGQKVTLEIDGYTNPVDYLINSGYIARPHFEMMFHENSELDLFTSTLSLTDNISEQILDNLAEDDQRNMKIVLSAKQLSDKHKRMIIFASSVKHSETIAIALQALGIQAYSITAKTSEKTRRQIIARFKGQDDHTQVLCNYGVLTTGFDAPQTSAVIIARPTKSLVLYSQMVGRAIRGPRAGGNESAKIVTVVDKNLPGFGSVAEAFTNWEDIWE